MPKTTADKQKQLISLAKQRQQVVRSGYKNIGDFKDGAYECDYISPYTKSANNVNANVMIMLQDWVGDKKLSGPLLTDAIELGQIPSLPTNKRLKALLNQHFGLALSETYATNLFPLIKHGNLSAMIPNRDLLWAAIEFAIPQIKIINPRLVICLGLKTFNSLRKAYGLKRSKNMAIALAEPFGIGEGSKFWCQAHTGTFGQNNRGREQVEKDWARMACNIINEE